MCYSLRFCAAGGRTQHDPTLTQLEQPSERANTSKLYFGKHTSSTRIEYMCTQRRSRDPTSDRDAIRVACVLSVLSVCRVDCDRFLIARRVTGASRSAPTRVTLVTCSRRDRGSLAWPPSAAPTGVPQPCCQACWLVGGAAGCRSSARVGGRGARLGPWLVSRPGCPRVNSAASQTPRPAESHI